MDHRNEDVRDIIEELRSRGNDAHRAGMARFGINTDQAFGISIPPLRELGKLIGKDHDRALALWESGWHEARLLAVFTDESKSVTEEQMEHWALGFNSWDITDQCCSNLFIKTPYAVRKVKQWASREEEFVRRAAFAMLAALAVHSKTLKDDDFHGFFPLIVTAATDERNFVKKAVNWSVRQIGKRNLALHADAIALAEKVSELDSRSAKWIARDALRELHSDATIARIIAKENKGKRSS